MLYNDDEIRIYNQNKNRYDGIWGLYERIMTIVLVIGVLYTPIWVGREVSFFSRRV